MYSRSIMRRGGIAAFAALAVACGGSGGGGEGGASTTTEPAGGAGGGGTAGPCARVFITKAAYSGDLKTVSGKPTGLEGADELCRAAAEGAGMTGSFRAYLATTAGPAFDRLVDEGAYCAAGPNGAKGAPLFASKAGWKAGAAMALSTDERGDPVDDTALPFSGTCPSKTYDLELGAGDFWLGYDPASGAPTTAAATCNDWSSTAPTYCDGPPLAGFVNTDLGSEAAPSCKSELHLLCFEVTAS